MIKKLSKFGILLFVAFVGSVAAFSQIRSCNLQLKIETYIEGSFTETVEVKNVNAILLNLKTKSITKQLLKNGNSFFPNQKEGVYRITIQKKGYETTIDKFWLDCYFAKDGVYLKEIVIFPGSSKKVVEIKRGTGDVTKAPAESPSQMFPDAVLVGIVNDKAINLVKPQYSEAAKAVKAEGEVSVSVVIDENGKVVWARWLTGHPLLRPSAEKAARESTFSPTILDGKAVKISGVVVYNFVP